MIYLIGGSPRCGKTILSKRIAHKKKISYISTDNFREVILHSIQKTDVAKKFPQTKLKTSKNKFRFEVYSSRELLKAQLKEADSMWPGLKAFINSVMYRDQDCVIEGVHLLPKHIFALKKVKEIKIVYLVKINLADIAKGFSKNTIEPDWMYPSIKDNKKRIIQAAEMVASKGEYFDREAKKYKLKVINTEQDFLTRLKEAERYLLK